MVASVITTPFMAAVLVLIYFDLRVRKEGFDLQLLSQGVGLAGAVYPGAASWLGGPGGPGGGYWGDVGELRRAAGGRPGRLPGGPSAGGGPGSGWAAPGSGLAASDPPTAPPPAPGPRFDDPDRPHRAQGRVAPA